MGRDEGRAILNKIARLSLCTLSRGSNMPLFDVLEVLLFHKPGSQHEPTLKALALAAEPEFGVIPSDVISSGEFDHSKQLVRFRALTATFETISAFDAAVRTKIGDKFQWQMVAAVPLGGTDTFPFP
jgi:hypothetical protein